MHVALIKTGNETHCVLLNNAHFPNITLRQHASSFGKLLGVDGMGMLPNEFHALPSTTEAVKWLHAKTQIPVELLTERQGVLITFGDIFRLWLLLTGRAILPPQAPEFIDTRSGQNLSWARF